MSAKLVRLYTCECGEQSTDADHIFDHAEDQDHTVEHEKVPGCKQ